VEAYGDNLAEESEGVDGDDDEEEEDGEWDEEGSEDDEEGEDQHEGNEVGDRDKKPNSMIDRITMPMDRKVSFTKYGPLWSLLI
jgi:hypothetical protein